MSAVPPHEAAPPLAASPPMARRCENCGAPLLGEHCHACGQPIKGLVRHFSSVLGDFFDTVFNIDSRVLRTIGPLMLRPGYLSLEYFAGRRVRYVTPMRLFLFLSLLAFFAIQASIEIQERGNNGAGNSNEEISSAKTPAQVQAILDEGLKELDKARREAGNVPAAGVGLDIARDQLKEQADDQIAYLKSVEKAKAAGKPPPAPPRDNSFNIPINGKNWNPESNPVAFAWLPDGVNKLLNRRMTRARDVLKSSNSEKPLIDAMFNVLPQTLIVLMPLFALMLKIAYWFKRRLYMEHLIVALHSHAFIALALTLVMAFSWLEESAASSLQGVFGFVRVVMIVWMPLYLLLMQKRVYGQGWLMTLIKFAVLGLCYTILLGMGMVAAVLIGLLTL